VIASVISLPDTAPLLAGASGTWRRLGERFRASGLTTAYVRSVEGDAPSLPEPARSRLTRLLHRRTDHPASLAVRLFVFGEALPKSAIRDLLGARLLEAARDGGLILDAGDRLTCPFRLDVVNGLYVLADHETRGPDSVMPVGESTQLLLQASYPQGDLREALDLGCGSGVIALLLAGAARRVVATDANPRAVALARFNAELNGLANVEVLEGDLWAPVDGRRFDLVVSQPPFHARPAGVDPVRFLHGGERGDELPRRVVAGLPRHLSRGGHGFVMSDFPWDDALPVAASLRADLGSPVPNLLVLRLETLADAEIECARQASLREPDDDAAFAASFDRLRSHLAGLGVGRIQQAIVVVEEAGPGVGWTREVAIPADSWRSLRRPLVDELLARGEDPLPLSGAAAGR